MLDHLDARAARRWGVVALEHLGDRRDEIDGLNVFPVPDGDTGTNMYLTIEAAVAAVEELPAGADLPAVADAFARGALLGARGNSGVILSQLLRGWADVLAERPDAGADTVRAAMDRATQQAYAAVGRPVEGTMLTVVRAASQAAEAYAGSDLVTTFERALSAAREALARTTEQLEALARAGVVDAGAQGVVVLMEALAGTLSGHRMVRRRARPSSGPSAAQSCGELSADGTAYEVMYLLDAADAEVAALRTALDALGDSLVVVGGAGLWNVHVHTDDVGGAIEAGVLAGRPHRIQVTRFADQRELRARASGASGVSGEPGGPGAPGAARIAVVAAAAGPGLARLFGECGAVVVPTGAGRRPSTAELLAAVRATGAEFVVLLPNDPDTLAAANAAATVARDEGLQVAVLPTRAAVQGLAAIAVHDASSPARQDLVRMAAAAAATRHGAVTVAARDALTSAGWCQVGDGLGILDGDVVEVSSDLRHVARSVVARMLSSGGELLTVVIGHDPTAQALAQAVVDEVRATRRDVEVSVVDGGQEGYPLLLGLE